MYLLMMTLKSVHNVNVYKLTFLVCHDISGKRPGLESDMAWDLNLVVKGKTMFADAGYSA